MTTIKTLINDLVFENINDKYAWGNYGEFKVMIMKENGYINVTKLCKSGGKEFFKWKENKTSDLFLEEVSSVLRIQRTDLLITVKGGDKNLQMVTDTYAHPSMVHYIASWVSGNFSIKAGFIVAAYFSSEEKERCARLEAEKNRLNGENIDLVKMFKDSERKREEKARRAEEARLKADEEYRKSEEERKKSEERYMDMCKKYGFQADILVNVKETLEATEEKMDINNELMEINNERLEVAIVRLEHVEEKLGIAKEIVVPKEQNIEYHEMFTLLKRRNVDPESEWEYYAICSKKKYVKTSRARKIRTDGMVEVLNFEYTPNTKNILHRVKEQLRDSIDFKGNNIDRKPGVSERRLLSLIRDIEKERVEIMD
jgi:hypothetical protein